MNASTLARFDQRLSPGIFDTVRANVREQMAREGLDVIITDSAEDVAYLTGFFHHACERPVAVWLDAAGDCTLLLPELEREHAESQGTRAALVSYPEYPGLLSPFAVLANSVVGRGRRIGHTTQMIYERLAQVQAELPDDELLPTNIVQRARYRKLPEEIALHAEAARVTDAMLGAGVEFVAKAIAEGGTLPTEAELAGHVTQFGVQTMYNDHENVVVVSPLAGGLVYAGANSAFPHGLPSSYRLKPGDSFMLSLGCAVGGRFVEGERTFILGSPTPQQRRYHEVVELAQRVGGEAIRPGAECRDVNEVCLAVIREAGLGHFIKHRQGHGIGLGVHEPPWLESGDSTVLREGMIVSNEPGIYIPGHAGYRISDSMHVTGEGSRPLTSFGRGLDACVIPL